eukprot:TCALIF_14036-PA protein Name:"Protein of unknown function" AED:0.01 eAED:0.01 QI:101/1/0.5/1/0/0.5/2/0/51
MLQSTCIRMWSTIPLGPKRTNIPITTLTQQIKFTHRPMESIGKAFKHYSPV